MAFFKQRPSGSPSSRTDSASEPARADQAYLRARHRLIGASILVIAAVLVLPWVFDAQPPTVSPNIPIAISGQDAPQVPAATNVALAPVNNIPAPAETEAPETGNAPEPAKPAPQPAAASAPAHPVEKPTKPAAKEETKHAEAPAHAPTEKTPAQRKPANLDELIAQRQAKEKPQPAAAAPAQAPKPEPVPASKFPEKGRFVVQIGAFVDAGKVANVRQQLEKAGLKTYTQQITLNGQQVTRVRIGPFSTRKEMEQAANKVRALGLPVSMYQL